MVSATMDTDLVYREERQDACPAEIASIKDYFTLLKPGVMSLVVFSAFAGMMLAPGHLHPFLQIVTIVCVALGSGAGAALNMWYDRDIDAVMRRTQKRPIPSGKIEAADVLFVGIFLAVFSVAILGLAVGWDAAALLAFAIWFYAYVYTVVLKRNTPQNIVIGGAAGAFPPMIGWMAVTHGFAWESFIYFLIILLWTPPHFWALALYRNEDYRTANIPMMPVTAGELSTKRQMLFYTIILVLVTLLPVVMHTSGALYGVVAAVLGVLFLKHALRVKRSDVPRDAMRMFGFSILYLFALFTALLVDRWLGSFLI